jgi:hypothetical protein
MDRFATDLPRTREQLLATRTTKISERPVSDNPLDKTFD